MLKQLLVTIVGGALLLTGLALLFLPGPGLVVIAAGLAILASRYRSAARVLDAVRRRLRDTPAGDDA